MGVFDYQSGNSLRILIHVLVMNPDCHFSSFYIDWLLQLFFAGWERNICNHLKIASFHTFEVPNRGGPNKQGGQKKFQNLTNRGVGN